MVGWLMNYKGFCTKMLWSNQQLCPTFSVLKIINLFSVFKPLLLWSVTWQLHSTRLKIERVRPYARVLFLDFCFDIDLFHHCLQAIYRNQPAGISEGKPGRWPRPGFGQSEIRALEGGKDAWLPPPRNWEGERERCDKNLRHQPVRLFLQTEV